jgi:hypothetical protein
VDLADCNNAQRHGKKNHDQIFALMKLSDSQDMINKLFLRNCLLGKGNGKPIRKMRWNGADWQEGCFLVSRLVAAAYLSNSAQDITPSARRASFQDSRNAAYLLAVPCVVLVSREEKVNLRPGKMYPR